MGKNIILNEVYNSSIVSAPELSIKRSFMKDMEKIMADIMNEVNCYPINERQWMKEAFCEFLESKTREAKLVYHYGGKHGNN